MTDRQTELLPCPFCGGTEIEIRRMPSQWQHPEYAAQCGECLTINGTSLGMDAAAQEWNTRATPDYVKPLVDALKKIEAIGYELEKPNHIARNEIAKITDEALSKLPEDLR